MSNRRMHKCRSEIPTLYFIILLFECSNVLRFAVSFCFFAVTPYSLRSTRHVLQSLIITLNSSEFALSSGAYMALALVGRALNLPGISARRR
jgi:hypothetical protein